MPHEHQRRPPATSPGNHRLPPSRPFAPTGSTSHHRHPAAGHHFGRVAVGPPTSSAGGSHPIQAISVAGPIGMGGSGGAGGQRPGGWPNPYVGHYARESRRKVKPLKGIRMASSEPNRLWRSRGISADLSDEIRNFDRGNLRRTQLVPAMARSDASDHDRIRLFRNRGQSAHSFADFIVDTRRALSRIQEGRRGQQLLSGLNDPETGARSRLAPDTTTLIRDARRVGGDGNQAAPEPDAFGLSMDAYRLGLERGDLPGAGLAAHVSFDPDQVHPRLPGGASDGPRPAFIGLAHELVHAHRYQRGLGVDPNSFGVLGRQAEEVETTGMVDAPQGITENTIRAEHHLPLRTTYGGAGLGTFRENLRRTGFDESY